MPGGREAGRPGRRWHAALVGDLGLVPARGGRLGSLRRSRRQPPLCGGRRTAAVGDKLLRRVRAVDPRPSLLLGAGARAGPCAPPRKGTRSRTRARIRTPLGGRIRQARGGRVPVNEAPGCESHRADLEQHPAGERAIWRTSGHPRAYPASLRAPMMGQPPPLRRWRAEGAGPPQPVSLVRSGTSSQSPLFTTWQERGGPRLRRTDPATTESRDEKRPAPWVRLLSRAAMYAGVLSSPLLC